MLKRLWNNTKFWLTFGYHSTFQVGHFIFRRKRTAYYIPVEELPDPSTLQFTETDLEQLIIEFVRDKHITPTHLFLSSDMLRSLLYSVRHKYERIPFSSKYGAYELVFQSYVGNITINMVDMGTTNFVLLGQRDAYNKFLVDKHILGSHDETPSDR